MRIKTCPLIFKALILGVLGIHTHLHAQIDHSSHSKMGGSSRGSNACVGFGLECANAATPFVTKDGQLLLAWTANGIISVAQSPDLGQTFVSPVKIAEHGKSLDTGSDARPQIVADSTGNVFVAYTFFKDSNWNAQINTARSRDGGLSFTNPEPLIKDGVSQRFPSILIRPDNSIFMAWVDKRLVSEAKKNGEKKLGGSIAYAFLRNDGGAFTAERIANENSCECCRIGAALNPENDPAIIYRAIFPGGIRDHATQIISPKGAEPIRRVSDDQWKTDACPHHGPSIAISATGKMHVAWFTQGERRSGVFYANSTNRGRTYSKPIRIGAEGANVSRPYLLALGQNVYLVWKEFNGSISIIYLKQSNNDGKTWSDPLVLAETSGYSDHPLLISHGDEVYLSWLTRADGYQMIKIGKN